MGKTRELFKDIREAKGIFHAKMGTIKDRNCMGCRLWGPTESDTTEVTQQQQKDTKKKWQEYIEELYKKYLHDPDNHNSVITHLEPDILD